MAYKVNGQLVAEQLVHEEFLRIGRDPQWNSITDLAERARQIRLAAEQRAINRVLIEQAAANDPRPIDDAAIDEDATQVRIAIKETLQWVADVLVHVEPAP